MSILRTYLDGFWRDVCQVDTRFRVGSNWFKVKNNDFVYANNAWRKIICTYAYKLVIDYDYSECEKTTVLVDVPFTLANPFVQYPQNFDYIAQTPGTIPVLKKNMITGHYLFNLDWIYVSAAGPGPGVFEEAFADGSPSYHKFVTTPIGQINDATLYPSASINFSGIGNYNLMLRGHIDPQGRIWIDAADRKSITAYSSTDPAWHMRVFYNDYQSEFGAVNPGVNTGYIINHKYKRVTNDDAELPLDANNQLVTIGSGNVQDHQDIGTSDANYRMLNTDKCTVSGTTYGNEVKSQVFTKNDCPGGNNATTETYTVPANTYYGVSVAAANQQALDDIAFNGQNYANTVGQCNPAASVVINYKNLMGSNPLTWVGLVFYRNGVQTDMITSDSGDGSQALPSTYRIGDTITIQQFHYFGTFPWAPTSKGNMKVLRNNSFSLYDADNSNANTTVLNSLVYTLAIGDVSLDITGTGSSAAVNYINKSLVSTNNATAEGALSVEIDDNTGAVIALNVNPQRSLGTSNSYPFNYLNDGGLLSVKMKNNGSTAMTYSLSGDASFTSSGTIAAGVTTTISNVPKGTVSLTVSN